MFSKVRDNRSAAELSSVTSLFLGHSENSQRQTHNKGLRLLKVQVTSTCSLAQLKPMCFSGITNRSPYDAKKIRR